MSLPNHSESPKRKSTDGSQNARKVRVEAVLAA